ncbi:MAG: 50S ribosomal protein L31 [Acidimicrobiales bacterium]
MRADIHPEYTETTVTCSCGNSFTTRSTAGESLPGALWGEGHPCYTGKQKLVDSGGRIDRFERRYGKRKSAAAAPADS